MFLRKVSRAKQAPKVIMGEKLFAQDDERTAWYRRMLDQAKGMNTRG
jgi:hypothetical protein